MPWVKLDDDFLDHIKVVRAGRDARELWIAALLFSSKNLTDGYVPSDLLDYLAGKAGVSDPANLAHRLVNVHLWEEAEGGWLIVDFDSFRATLPPKQRDQRRKEWESRCGPIRRRILHRDGFRCRNCGSSGLLEVDHIRALAIGGGNDEDNLQTLCRRCNRSKGIRSCPG